MAALDTALRLSRAQGLRQAEAANRELLAEVHRLAGDHRTILAEPSVGVLAAHADPHQAAVEKLSQDLAATHAPNRLNFCLQQRLPIGDHRQQQQDMSFR